MTQAMKPASKQVFGFRFWLMWILWFAGALLGAALFWTALATACFGRISEPEIVLTWSMAVFGSWFVLLTPFMRKKEQIWKRLNQDQEKAVDAWLGALGFFIGLLVASSFFWSWKLKGLVFSASPARFHPLWCKAVFSSWLFFTFPFLIFLYRKANSLFKNAVIRQFENPVKFRSAFVDRSRRLLPRHADARQCNECSLREDNEGFRPVVQPPPRESEKSSPSNCGPTAEERGSTRFPPQ